MGPGAIDQADAPAASAPSLRSWLPRSIVVRVVAGLTVLIVAVIASLDVIVGAVARDTQLERLEQQVVQQVSRRPPGPAPGQPAGPGPPGPPVPVEAGTAEQLAALGPRLLAQLVLRPDGEILVGLHSGAAGELDPLPSVAVVMAQLPEPPPGPVPPPVGRQVPIFTVTSDDGTVAYRAAVRWLAPDAAYAVAATTAEVEETASRIRRAFIAFGALATLLLVAGSAVVVRRGLAPLRRVTQTAQRVEEGDLETRVEGVEPGSEVGRLAATFNAMLDALHAAIRQRDRKEVRLKAFVSDAGHELRTPLTAMRGYSKLYERGALDDPERLGQVLQSVERNSLRMQRLVDDLLTLAKLDQEAPIEREPVDLGAVAADAVEDARVIEPDRPLALEVDGRPHVIGDDQKLRQVIDNLLSNARSHTPADVAVTVGVESRNGEVVLTVADRGPGIPDDQLDRLFDRFYRADPARARDRAGSGLGLAIVQGIADAHGGTVDVTSEVGAGTTFTVRLPARSDGHPRTP